MNNTFERIWEEGVVIYKSYYISNCLAGLRKTSIHLGRDSGYAVQNSKQSSLLGLYQSIWQLVSKLRVRLSGCILPDRYEKYTRNFIWKSKYHLVWSGE